MWKSCLVIAVFFSSLAFISAQDTVNVMKVGQLDFQQNCADIWGYVDSAGREYAVLTTRTGTALIGLSDPANPMELLFIPGENTTWRDAKSYDDHIYVIGDNVNEGLLSIDMSAAPDSFTWQYVKPAVITNGDTLRLKEAHNLFIDDRGLIYLSGSNLNNGGIVVLDAAADPDHPPYVNQADSRYSHDNMVRNDTIFSADVIAGFFSVIDATDTSRLRTIATQTTSRQFTHNCWASDDGKYLFTTDERSGAFIDAYDIRDLNDIQRIDQFQTVNAIERQVIPHNVVYHDSFLLISYYTDGLVIVDAHRPENLVQVGAFDTHPENNTGFRGCWGVYPWFPSGLIIASDVNRGLFVFQVDFQRAAYLEGRVTNEETEQAIPGVDVVIVNQLQNRDQTDNAGKYKTGIPYTGEAQVTFSHPFYYSDTFTVNLVQGQLLQLDVPLRPLYRSYVLLGTVLDKSTDQPIQNAEIELVGIDDYLFKTGANGQFGGYIFEGDYRVEIGKWGYRNILDSIADLSSNSNIEFRLKPGYQDDFIVDQGWVVYGNAASGHWQRGVPQGTSTGDTLLNPPFDAANDLGFEAYVTGNNGISQGDDDVDNGFTVLQSPKLDLSEMELPVFRFSYWFANYLGDTIPNDTLFANLFFQAEDSTITLDKYFTNTGDWQAAGPYLLDSINLDLTSVFVRFFISDLRASPHITEAGIDAFVVYDSLSTAVDHPGSVGKIPFRIYPNPTTDYVHLDFDGSAEQYAIESFAIYNAEGREMIEGTQLPSPIPVGKLRQGLYFLRLTTDSGIFVLPFVKAGP